MFVSEADTGYHMTKVSRLAFLSILLALGLATGGAVAVDAAGIKEIGGDTLRTETRAPEAPGEGSELPGLLDRPVRPGSPERPGFPEAPEAPEVPTTPDVPEPGFGTPRVFELESRDREGRGIRFRIDLDEDTLSISPEVRRRPRRGAAERQSIVRVGGDIVIDEDENVRGSVVSIGGDITVFGTVEGDVFAMGGDIALRDGAVVEGDVNSIGGTVRTSRFAELGGENNEFSVNLFGGGWRDRPEVSLVLWSIIFAALFVSGWLLLFLAPRRAAALAEHVRARIWASFFVGLALCAAFLPSVIILAITVIGIPLAILLPFAYMFVLLIGYVGVITLVGSRLADSTSTSLSLKGLLFGALLFLGFYIITRALSHVPGPAGVFGSLLALFAGALNWVAAMIGFGAFVLSRFGGRRLDGDAPSWAAGQPPPAQPRPSALSLPPRPGSGASG